MTTVQLDVRATEYLARLCQPGRVPSEAEWRLAFRLCREAGWNRARLNDAVLRLAPRESA